MKNQVPLNFDDLHKQYQIGKVIGEGKFGTVCKAVSFSSNRERALKLIDCKSQQDIKYVQEEIQIMKQLDHPHIIKLLQHYRQNYSTRGSKVICRFGLLMELGECSLEEALLDQNYNFSMPDVKRFTANLIAVGAYMQSKCIVNRDIKPANFIIFGSHLDFKLADFGLACHKDLRPKGFAGTFDFCSPLLKQYYHSKHHHQQIPSDPIKDQVYSVGITIQKILKAFYLNWRQQITSEEDQNFTFVLEEILKQNERERPTFLDLMKSNFVSQELQIKRNPILKTKKIQNRQKSALLREIQPETVNKLKQHFEDYKNVNQIGEIQFSNDNQTEIIPPKFDLSQHHFFYTGFKISSVCRLNSQFILCGNDEGKIAVFDCLNSMTCTLSLSHDNYVVQIKLDQNGNIWTASTDGYLFFFQRQNLLNCIENKVRQKTQKIKSLFSVELKTTLEIQIDEGDFKMIRKLPNKNCITDIYCHDQLRYIIAFSDGTIHISWYHRQLTYHSPYQLLPKIKVHDNFAYISFYKGFIIRFDLNTITKDNFLLQCDSKILDFRVFNRKKKTYIEIVNDSANIEEFILKESQKYQSIQDKKKKRAYHCLDMIGSCQIEGSWILLSEDGTIFQRYEEILCQNQMNKNWSCMAYSDGWLVSGSEEGVILLIEVERYS